MFVGVVVENFHRCRIEQEREERAVRAIKTARKNEEKRKSIIALYHFVMGDWFLLLRITREAILVGV